MSNPEYEIALYRPEFKDRILKLLLGFWSHDLAANRAYFDWKYEGNPNTSSPTGIVALQNDNVVGFRGYFVSRYAAAGKNDNIPILVPSDTCVSNDHRRKGLSIKMGKMAMQEFAASYPLFVSISCNRGSLPGNLALGFLTLTEKAFLTHASLRGTLRYLSHDRGDAPFDDAAIRCGRFESIEVSTKVRAAEMAAICSSHNRERSALALVQDEQFFNWRFCNPQRKYAFYYSLGDDGINGYVVIGLSHNNRRGFILDFAEAEAGAIDDILRYVSKAKHFDAISIYDYCLNQPLAETLRTLGFSRNNLIRVFERRITGEFPILVRPVRQDYAEGDLQIEGLDVRDLKNWSLKPICSDDA